jgi:hypothetical protein
VDSVESKSTNRIGQLRFQLRCLHLRDLPFAEVYIHLIILPFVPSFLTFLLRITSLPNHSSNPASCLHSSSNLPHRSTTTSLFSLTIQHSPLSTPKCLPLVLPPVLPPVLLPPRLLSTAITESSCGLTSRPDLSSSSSRPVTPSGLALLSTRTSCKLPTTSLTCTFMHQQG